MTSPPVNPRRPRRKPPGRFHHGDLAEALAHAASSLIEREGHDAVSLKRLAQTVGVTEPALYKHYPSKQALLAVVGMRGLSRFEAAIVEPAARFEDPFDALYECGRAYVRFAYANAGWFRLWFSREWNDELSLLPQAATQPSAASSRVVLRNLAVRIVGKDLPVVDDINRAAWAMAHGLAGLVIERAFRLVKTDEERLAAADEALRVLVDSLRARFR
ncbi:MAG: TetR/AcrR family transcriptional regulator [Polyangiaceae bacterium]|nr:TetR/AcrR family transcriptional regulator [Polyangiaceae bacterium]